MWKQSENIVHRLFMRELIRPSPNTHIHQARRLYENVVPNHTVYDVECPDHSFRKFTNDGQYFICFSRSHQELIVYRPKVLHFVLKGDETDRSVDLPTSAKKFDNYFVHLYNVALASGSEVICKDFFLSTDNYLYGIFATSTASDIQPPPANGPLPAIPTVEKTTLIIVRLEDGVITDERVYLNDLIHLTHNTGVFLYDDLLSVLSIRHQCIRILQIRDTGRFVDVHTIGAFCREDDELVLNLKAQDEAVFQRQQAAVRKARGLPSQEDTTVPRSFLDVQGSAWPPQWNLGFNQGHISRARRNNRDNGTRSSSAQAPSTEISGSSVLQGDVSSSFPNRVTGIYGGMRSADLDLQYDNYFDGLLASFGHASGGQQESTVLRGDSSANLGLTNLNPHRQNIIESSDYRYSFGRPAGETPSRRAHPAFNQANGHVRVTQTGRSGLTSGSTGNQASFGPAVHGRLITDTSRGTSDRHSGGRESSSIRYTSAMTSSGSSGGSDVSRRDMSTGGTVYSNGSRHGGHGSSSNNSLERNNVEYVVSSRVQVSAETRQQPQGLEELSVSNGITARASPSHVSPRHSEGGARSSNPVSGIIRASSVNHREQRIQVANGDSPMVDSVFRTNGRPLYRSSERDGLAPEWGAHRSDVTEQTPLRESNMAVNLIPSQTRSGQEVHHSQVALARTSREPSDEEKRSLLGGLKQRLLTFIYLGICNQEASLERQQRIQRFYYHFQHYVDLIIWKVQFLDRYHLLIKLGSVEGVVQRNSDISHQTAFLAVYNLETTQMLGFFQNSSEEFLLSFEHYCDHFRALPRYPLYMNFISSFSNNIYAQEQLRKQRGPGNGLKIGNSVQVAKRTLAWLPYNSQCHSPSVYFDHCLFQYDEKLISAIDRHKPCMDHPIKFISRRRPNVLKFRINTGPEFGSTDGRVKRVASFIFHPTYPFAMSIQQSFMQPPVINFHIRK